MWSKSIWRSMVGIGSSYFKKLKISIRKFGWSLHSMQFLLFFGKQGVNLACGTKNLQTHRCSILLYHMYSRGCCVPYTPPGGRNLYPKNYLTLPKLEKCTWPCLNVRPQCMSFWGGDIGDALWFSRHLTDWTISCIVPKIWAVDVAVKLRSRPKRWFLGHRFAEGIADIGHVFSNRSHFWAYGQYWFSSVHRARRLGGEKKKEERIRPKI